MRASVAKLCETSEEQCSHGSVSFVPVQDGIMTVNLISHRIGSGIMCYIFILRMWGMCVKFEQMDFFFL